MIRLYANTVVGKGIVIRSKGRKDTFAFTPYNVTKARSRVNLIVNLTLPDR